MSSKLERDIDEVLAKIERLPPRRSIGSRIRRRLGKASSAAGRALGGVPRPRASVGQILLLGIVVIVIGYVFGESLGGGSVVRLAIIGGIVLFIAAFIVSLRKQSASRIPEKRWRGQPLNLDEPDDSRSWWARWRARR